jgi:hypothetical protein
MFRATSPWKETGGHNCSTSHGFFDVRNKLFITVVSGVQTKASLDNFHKHPLNPNFTFVLLNIEAEYTCSPQETKSYMTLPVVVYNGVADSQTTRASAMFMYVICQLSEVTGENH